jgi:hypothetical protein
MIGVYSGRGAMFFIGRWMEFFMHRSGNAISRDTWRDVCWLGLEPADSATVFSRQPGNSSFWLDMLFARVKIPIFLPLCAAIPNTATKDNFETTLVPHLPRQEGGGDGFRVNI